MIYRVVIIIIVIVNSSNEFFASYVFIVAFGMIALTHLPVRPYNFKILKLDGIFLSMIVFIAVLPILDDFDSSVVISITFILVMLPLIIFITFTL